MGKYTIPEEVRNDISEKLKSEKELQKFETSYLKIRKISLLENKVFEITLPGK